MDGAPILLAAALLLSLSASFFVSASAGLGGSLLLVPALTIVVGSKQAITIAAVLLAANNLVKIGAYRRFLPWRASAAITICSVAGAFLGARVLVSAPERLVDMAVVTSLAAALLFEKQRAETHSPLLGGGLAFAAGATSGFAGTSGPLKGAAIRSLRCDRMQTVGAAAIVSAAADGMKAGVFGHAGLLDGDVALLALAAVPLMIVATFAGRQFTQRIGERHYARLFWLVIGGYAARLLLAR
jgi:uncharacterized protein